MIGVGMVEARHHEPRPIEPTLGGSQIFGTEKESTAPLSLELVPCGLGVHDGPDRPIPGRIRRGDKESTALVRVGGPRMLCNRSEDRPADLDWPQGPPSGAP